MVSGRFGLLPAAVATPLALVLTELLQNALQHGLVTGRAQRRPGLCWFRRRASPGLTVRSRTAGWGCRKGSAWTRQQAWACRSCARWWTPNSAAELEIWPRPGGGTSVQVSPPVEAMPPTRRQPGEQDSAGIGHQRKPAAAGKAAAG